MSSYEFEVRSTDHDGVVLVELGGELDLTSAAELECRLEEAGERGSSLIVDLNGVSFLDSAALHVLFRLARRLEADQKRFGIVLEPTALAARTLAIVGLDEVTRIRSSLDEVLDSSS